MSKIRLRAGVRSARCASVIAAHALLVLGQYGCAADVEQTAPTDIAPIQQADEALRLGDRGEQVRAIYVYLARVGYFPNAELSATYPGFEPLVDEGPADALVFDERLERGVLLFQERNGIEQTGVVDTATRAAMTYERCASPDGYGEHARGDGFIDKFAANPVTFPDPTWSVESWPASLGEEGFAALINQAINPWRAVHPSAIARAPRGTTAARNIQIEFDQLDGAPVDSNNDRRCDSGCIAGLWNGAFRILTIDHNEPWVFNGTPTTWPQVDLLSVVTHEIGHALGLNHSDISAAMMYATQQRGTAKRNLHLDDTMAIRSAYGAWGVVSAPTTAVMGLGIGPNDHFFILANEASPGGLKVYRFNGSGWTNIPGGAVTVAADARGRAWVTNGSNQLFFSATGDTGFHHVPNVCARNADVSNGGRVWILGCDGQMWESPIDPAGTDSQVLAQLGLGWRQWPMPGGRSVRSFAANTGNSSTSVPIYAASNTGELWLFGGNTWAAVAISSPINIDDLGVANDPMAMWAVDATTRKVFASNRQFLIPGADTPGRGGWQESRAPNSLLIDVTRGGKPYALSSTFQLITTFE